MKTTNSKTLALLDRLGVAYTIRGREAFLNDHDSLKINLDKRVDSWKRWATGDSGPDGRSLVRYMVEQGWISGDVSSVSGTDPVKGKTIQVEEATPFNWDTFVINDRPDHLRYYLEEKRKLSPIVIDALLSKGKIVQDGRDSIRFLWMSPNNKVTGCEIVGTSEEKIRYIQSGSRGLFYVLGRDLKDIRDAERLIFFEAPIDLISYLELIGYQNKDLIQQATGLNLPEAHPKTAFVSLSGSVTKIDKVLKELRYNWGISLNQKQLVVATDADPAGDETFEKVKKVYPNTLREKTEGRTKPIKDWNDLLKEVKEASRG